LENPQWDQNAGDGDSNILSKVYAKKKALDTINPPINTANTGYMDLTDFASVAYNISTCEMVCTRKTLLPQYKCITLLSLPDRRVPKTEKLTEALLPV